MGTRLPFCIRRGAIFYWRRRLPSPAKMSVEFSLGTKDERVARRLCSLLAIDSDRAFAVVREGGMTPEQAEAFMRHKFAEHRAKLELVHIVSLDSRRDWKSEIKASKATALAFNTLALRGRTGEVEPSFIEDDPDADEVLGLARQSIETYREDFWSEGRSLRIKRDLADLFPAAEIAPADVAQARSLTLRAYAAANASSAKKSAHSGISLTDLEALAERLEQAIDKLAEPASAAPKTQDRRADPEPTAESEAPAKTHIVTFTEETVAQERLDGRLVSGTLDQKLQVVNMFVWATGKEYFQDLKQSDIKRYVDCLKLIPKNHKAPVYEGLTADEMMAKASFLQKREVGLSAQTINRNLSYLTKLMRQAQMAGVERLPTNLIIGGFRLPKLVRDHEQRPGYTAENIGQLFSHPIWTGCHSLTRRHVPGNVIVWDGLYWCPLISAYSGMRREEIAGMQVAEVVLDADVPHFVVRVNDNRGLKTLASTRTVPIHPALFRLGIDRYVRMQQKSHRDLFPDLKPTKGTKSSWGDKLHYNFSKAVRLSLGVSHVEKDAAKTFHSFRHYICTALDRIETVKDKTTRDIVGHENVGTTDRVYKEPAALTLKLEALRFLPELTEAAATALQAKQLVPARKSVALKKTRAAA
jgi:integrase